MKTKARTLTRLMAISMMILGLTCALHASPASQALVAEGKSLLFSNGEFTTSGLLAANSKFKAGVQADAGDQNANLFFSITRVMSLMDNTVTYTPGAPIENVKEVLDNLGVSAEKRDLFDWGAVIPEDADGNILLPENLPSGQMVQDFFQSVIVNEIEGAIENLSIISNSYNLILTAFETGGDSDIEVDYGDILMYQSLLQALKGLLQVMISYDINLDINALISKIEIDMFNINSDLLSLNPDFLRLRTDGSPLIIKAKEDFLSAIDNYKAASTFIRNETDSQHNDLITLDSDDLANESEFRSSLDKIRDSFVNKKPVEFSDELVLVNFSEFFDDPISIRDYLPEFIYHTYHGDYKGMGSLPDRTFSDIFPDKLPQALESVINNGSKITQDLWARAIIHTEEGPIEAVWQKGGEDTTSRGDRVIWGYFYASPGDVSWGSSNNPEVFTKIWYDAGGRVDVNFFHVSVPDIEVFATRNGVNLGATATTFKRYIRHYYNDNNSDGTSENSEDGIPAEGFRQTNSPYGYSTANNLNIGATINTVESIGAMDAIWASGGQDTTTRGDQVVWGHFYADPNKVSWGSRNNPELFVKIWFDASGRIDVNYFHVSVPDIEVYSDYISDGIYDKKGTTIMDDRYIRHEYTRK